jgi:hypothetical protein
MKKIGDYSYYYCCKTACRAWKINLQQISLVDQLAVLQLARRRTCRSAELQVLRKFAVLSVVGRLVVEVTKVVDRQRDR